VEAVEDMSWSDIQALFAAVYVEEIIAVHQRGPAVVHEKLAALSEAERDALRAALLDAEPI
jgi:hypothetical protein